MRILSGAGHLEGAIAAESWWFRGGGPKANGLRLRCVISFGGHFVLVYGWNRRIRRPLCVYVFFPLVFLLSFFVDFYFCFASLFLFLVSLDGKSVTLYVTASNCHVMLLLYIVCL